MIVSGPDVVREQLSTSSADVIVEAGGTAAAISKWSSARRGEPMLLAPAKHRMPAPLANAGLFSYIVLSRSETMATVAARRSTSRRPQPRATSD